MGDESDARHALGDQQAAVDTRQANRVHTQVAQPGHELAVHDAPQDGCSDLERRFIGDPEAVLEVRWDAHPLEPFGDALAATVDEDHGTSSGYGRDLGEHLALLGDGRSPQLYDQYLRHRSPP